MSDKTIKDILGVGPKSMSTTTFNEYDETIKQQVVVAALLELYKAEALGGTSRKSVRENIRNIGEDVQHVLAALKGE